MDVLPSHWGILFPPPEAFKPAADFFQCGGHCKEGFCGQAA